MNENPTEAVLIDNLKSAGLYPGPQIFGFMIEQGVTPEEMVAKGFKKILLNIMADRRHTIADLVGSIKKNGNGKASEG